jgi:hypothetical protein
MKIHTFASALAAVVAGLCLAANAQATDAAVSADVGSLGAGLHLIVPVQDGFNARIGFSSYNYNYNGSTSDVDYDFKLKLQTIDALLDWYPLSGSFHLSGGFFHNGNKITSVAKPGINGSYTINGDTYTVAQAGSIDGSTDFRSAAPYLGIGWGNPASKEKGWGFTSDVGVVFQGAPSSTLTSSGCAATAQICTQLYNDLSVESSNLDQKTNNFKYYPVIRIGVSYSF